MRLIEAATGKPLVLVAGPPGGNAEAFPYEDCAVRVIWMFWAACASTSRAWAATSACCAAATDGCCERAVSTAPRSVTGAWADATTGCVANTATASKAATPRAVLTLTRPAPFIATTNTSGAPQACGTPSRRCRSEEHTSELQSP